MAKGETQLVRISQIAPAETLVVPVFNPSDIVGREMSVEAWEFKTSEKGGEYVTFTGRFNPSGLPFSCTSFDKAIIAQLMSIPADAPRPLAARVEPFGKYYQLK